MNCTRLRCVALTFDDGPVAGTNDLLDMLKSKGVKATLFVVGTNAKAHPEVLRRMVAEGHIIGNHSYSHAQLTRLSQSGVEKQIKDTNTLVLKATGRTPTLLRPPYGTTNPTVASAARNQGMAQILWNVDPLDWRDRNSATVKKRVLASTKRGSIVLSHDIHATTRAAYADIIDGLRAKGYTLVTVPELLGTTTPGRRYSSR